jgi:hypothetical protein
MNREDSDGLDPQHGYGRHPTQSSPRQLTYSEAEIAAILAELNRQVQQPSQLQRWSASTDIPLRRTVASGDLTYVGLAGTDHAGDPIVLMLIEGMWDRAI